jgi:hypothetical protein
MTELDESTFPRRGADVAARPQAADTLLPQGGGASPRSLSRPAPRWSRAESAVVEQAKGILMLRYGVGSYESFATLVRWSQDVDVTVVQIARTLTLGVCQGRTPSDDQGRWLLRWLEQRLREDIGDQSEAKRWSLDG